MSKGSWRRPQEISYEEFAKRWELAFGKPLEEKEAEEKDEEKRDPEPERPV